MEAQLVRLQQEVVVVVAVKKLLLIMPLIVLLGCTGLTGQAIVEGYFKIPLSEVSTTAIYYTYESFGKEIRFFAVLGSDGEVRTAFDACDVCGGSKGYRQQGSDMICNNCGRYFQIDSLGTKNRGGGCWPSYLSHKIEGDYILISKSDLSQGARFF